MFTGIVTDIGTVQRIAPLNGGLTMTIESRYGDLELGESIAVDGACLTVEALEGGRFTVHVIRTSLERTAFEAYPAGRRVNLERAARVGDRLGGHLVQGHVDGIATVERVADRDDARLLDLRVPETVARVSIALGSVTVDGVSLTVNDLPAPGIIQVSLIPFTLQQTTLGERRAGDTVQVEGDTIGKYVREFMR